MGELLEGIMTRSLSARRCDTGRASSVIEMTEVGRPTHTGNFVVGAGRETGVFLKSFPNLNPFCLRSAIRQKKCALSYNYKRPELKQSFGLQGNAMFNG